MIIFFSFNLIILLLLCSLQLSGQALRQAAKDILQQSNNLIINYGYTDALPLIQQALGDPQHTATDLAYQYAQQSTLFLAIDSLQLGKTAADRSIQESQTSSSMEAKAVAYRASAQHNNHLNLPDIVVKDALKGIQYLGDSQADPYTAYYLNYLLYVVYSKWNEEEKMHTQLKEGDSQQINKLLKEEMLANNDFEAIIHKYNCCTPISLTSSLKKQNNSLPNWICAIAPIYICR
mgnify:CR=1 FL=1